VPLRRLHTHDAGLLHLEQGQEVYHPRPSSNAIALTRGGNRLVQPARRRYGPAPYLLSTASLLLARFDQVRIGSIDATIITDGSCFSV
jgi:hypothetical protein